MVIKMQKITEGTIMKKGVELERLNEFGFREGERVIVLVKEKESLVDKLSESVKAYDSKLIDEAIEDTEYGG